MERVDLCNSCVKEFDSCDSGKIIFDNVLTKEKVIACAIYEPFVSKDKVEDNESNFPNRELSLMEMKLLIAKIIKYTANDIALALPPEHQLQEKILSSNMNVRLIHHCPDMLVRPLFTNIGASIRLHLSTKSELLGWPNERTKMVDMPILFNPNNGIKNG